MEVQGFEGWEHKVSAPLDRAVADAVAEDGPDMERMLRRERCHRAPRLMEQLKSQVDRFCRYANGSHGPPGFREAGELWKCYLRGELTMEAVSEAINGHARWAPPSVIPSPDGHLTIDDGGAVDGYRYLAQL